MNGKIIGIAWNKNGLYEWCLRSCRQDDETEIERAKKEVKEEISDETEVAYGQEGVKQEKLKQTEVIIKCCEEKKEGDGEENFEVVAERKKNKQEMKKRMSSRN